MAEICDGVGIGGGLFGAGESGENSKNRPSAAKAVVSVGVYGTTEVVP